jgi:hypothetical protein
LLLTANRQMYPCSWLEWQGSHEEQAYVTKTHAFTG